VRLIGQVVTVSLETMAEVEGLPEVEVVEGLRVEGDGASRMGKLLKQFPIFVDVVHTQLKLGVNERGLSGTV
jgi:hypothetical protein